MQIFHRQDDLQQACGPSILPASGLCDLPAALGQRLADHDEVDQGVIPSHMGEPVYLSLGYEVIGEMTVPDDGEVKGFTQRVVLYRAKR